jgi:hypothetical protein
MRVFVYRNLHKKCWSIKALSGPNRGRVIHHTHSFTLDDATFKVSAAGRARVLREQRKNVHAGIVGTLVDVDCCDIRVAGVPGIRVTYNPYQFDTFVDHHDHTPVLSSSTVWGCDRDVYASFTL